ncbi:MULTISPECIES: Gfo/Idh/MocA family protein [Sphingobium]|uniref:Gfo/Idh/MocA family protein n=1 Tax=Sphingobium sp. MI1205 TaxID=407020 RepID=UPI0007704167|nr:Gfo/Idh/MocA family oxidoreductase [Sphingobium sp. MI1205]AMK19915.1 putative oxidoreductase [Sphingobium sp. MI1205]
MATKVYGVGLVGVQAGRSWAAIAHIPAIQALSEDFRIVGIANTSLESAQRAVEATGAGRAFASVAELVNDPDVDIVAITVKVPNHFDVVNAAIGAGKAVYCEWPIGNGLAEAREMAERAREKNILAVAGTQARAAPAMRYVADLVAQGFVGEVLSSTLVGTGMNWGPMIEKPNAYTLDVRTGANMLTIPVGHTMAAIADTLGPVANVSARLATRRKTVHVVDTGEDVPMTAPDQVLVAATLESGAPLSIHYRGGMPRGTGLLWEINGTKGDIQVIGMGGHAQFVDLSVKGATEGDEGLRDLPVPQSYLPSQEFDMFTRNVAIMYAHMAHDLRTGESTAPTFSDAVRTHELIAAIELSAREGRSVSVKDV